MVGGLVLVLPLPSGANLRMVPLLASLVARWSRPLVLATSVRRLAMTLIVILRTGFAGVAADARHPGVPAQPAAGRGAGGPLRMERRCHERGASERQRTARRRAVRRHRRRAGSQLMQRALCRARRHGWEVTRCIFIHVCVSCGCHLTSTLLWCLYRRTGQPAYW